MRQSACHQLHNALKGAKEPTQTAAAGAGAFLTVVPQLAYKASSRGCIDLFLASLQALDQKVSEGMNNVGCN